MQIAAAPVIVHADLDAFYASVEQMDRPELRGKPVLVGGSPDGRGVVAACSYESRKFGVRSAMPMRTALRLCPDAVIVHPRFDRYHELSGQVMEMLKVESPMIEQVSIDEAYLDLSRQWRWPEAEASARALKARVRAEAGLVVSLGVATTKSAAKIASDLGKPDGVLLVQPGGEAAFLAPLPVRRLGGIGPRTEERLAGLGVKTLGELARQEESWLLRLFGKHGPALGQMSRGIDPREIVIERAAKSVSAEMTFPQDIADTEMLREAVARLCRRVGERMAKEGVRGRTVDMKFRLADFTTFTRSRTVRGLVADAASLLPVALALLESEPAYGSRKFRLLGVGVSNFAPAAEEPQARLL